MTKNPLLKEHVDFGLPDSEWVLSEMRRWGFEGVVAAHTSIAVWLGQYISLNLAPESAAELNLHLIENYANEPFSNPLYHLVVCKRVSFSLQVSE